MTVIALVLWLMSMPLDWPMPVIETPTPYPLPQAGELRCRWDPNGNLACVDSAGNPVTSPPIYMPEPCADNLPPIHTMPIPSGSKCWIGRSGHQVCGTPIKKGWPMQQESQ